MTTETRFNKIEAHHLGGGVVLFKNAVSADWGFVRETCEQIVSRERDEMYTEGTDPETGEPCFVNKSGYIFDHKGVMEMPRRGSSAHKTETGEFKRILDFLEESKDKCLLEYFYLFPLSYKVVWWKVKGHIVSYSKEKGGVFLGQHSDNSVDYAYGIGAPADEMPTRNSISAIVYLNDQVESEDQLDETNFVGGNHTFNYLDISYSPSKGDIMMFPSNYMAAHMVEKVTAGTRYTYLGWYSHGTPNPAVGESVVDPATEPDSAKVSTNVLMPTLREDFRKYLEERSADPSHHGFSLVRSMHS
jgi:hypothetical protein